MEHTINTFYYLLFAVDIKAEIEESSLEYTNNVAHLSKEERSKSLNKIQEMFKKATENSDNKVQIAMQMYEMVSTFLKSICTCACTVDTSLSTCINIYIGKSDQPCLPVTLVVATKIYIVHVPSVPVCCLDCN